MRGEARDSEDSVLGQDSAARDDYEWVAQSFWVGRINILLNSGLAEGAPGTSCCPE